MMKTSLGTRVRAARKARSLKRGTVAKLAGMAYSTLADIENDASGACTRIASLASALEVDAVWLETGDGAMDIPAESELRTIFHAQLEDFSQPRKGSLSDDEQLLLSEFARLSPLQRRLVLIDIKAKADTEAAHRDLDEHSHARAGEAQKKKHTRSA